MGCSQNKSLESGSSKMETIGRIVKEFPVRLPALPGDVLVSGDLPKEVVEQLAEHCKGWLYLNPETDPHYMGDTIKSKGSRLKVLPFKPTKDLAASAIDELVSSIAGLPRPLMIQCNSAKYSTSANRAAIGFLLWMAHQRGYTKGCVEVLVKERQGPTAGPGVRGGSVAGPLLTMVVVDHPTD
eukprot:Skav214687  [mRNA]  locus=scaffold444:92407:93423:+ [translate_table: standard]